MNKIQVLLSLLVVFLITWLAYSNHFQNDFHFDDHHTIVRNTSIRDLKNIPHFFVDATTTSTLPTNQAYRPGLTTLNALDFYLSGKNKPEPFQYHLSIFISFLLLGFLIFLLQKHILDLTLKTTINSLIAILACAFYLLHTANAETINYIIARSDSFSTLMIVLSFVLYIYLPKSRKLHLYFIPSALGFFVKEPSLMFIPLLFSYKLLFEMNMSLGSCLSNPSLLFKPLKQVSLPLLIGIALFIFSRMHTPVIWEAGGTSPLLYALTQPFVLIHYISNFILPVNLVVDTDWTLVSGVTDTRVVAGILFLSFYIYLIFITSKKEQNRGISFGLSWFLIALLPSSSFIPFAEVLNDHRTFFPYIGLVIALWTFIRNGIESTKLYHKPLGRFFILSLSMVILFLHGTGTYQRNKVWAREETLWEEATFKSPNNARAWMNYGIELMARGDYSKAENCFLKAQTLLPDYSYININLGILQSHTNRPIEAEKNFIKAIEMNVVVPEAYYYYAEFLITNFRFNEARSKIIEGLKWSPNHEQMNILRSTIEFALQMDDEHASNEVKVALSHATTNPTPENYLQLSLAEYNNADYEKCIKAAQESLKLRPSYDLAYNNICAAYNRLGRYKEAVEVGEKALSLNPKNELIKGNLAEAKSKIKP